MTKENKFWDGKILEEYYNSTGEMLDTHVYKFSEECLKMVRKAIEIHKPLPVKFSENIMY